MFLHSNSKFKKGFTVMELLVVVAIIAILAAITIGSLSAQRSKARINSAKTTAYSVVKPGIACLQDNFTLSSTTAGYDGSTPLAVCSGSSANWPPLPTGWTWGTSTPTYSNVSIQRFGFAAKGDGKIILCDHSGCTVTP
jgi:prepilin-type N-terminal cleavage/methylation domain-containing protein